MTVNDIPLISFFQRVLDPLIIMGTLYVVPLLYQRAVHRLFAGADGPRLLHLLRGLPARRPVQPGAAAAWLAYVRDTVLGWAMTIGVLLFLGSASGLHYYYDERVLLAWVLATPVILLASHLAVRRSSIGPGGKSEVRSVVVVGANNAGAEIRRQLRAPAEPVHGSARLLRRPRRRAPSRSAAASGAGQHGRHPGLTCGSTTSR